MEVYWIWWLAAVVLVIAEMNSGTFYLLAVAFGLAAAGLSAWLGMSWEGQAAIASLLCIAGVAAVHRWKRGQPAQGQPNLAYDIGQTVQALHWSDERHARVSYRGAEWDAELAGTASADPARQSWRIKEVSGSRLIIE